MNAVSQRARPIVASSARALLLVAAAASPPSPGLANDDGGMGRDAALIDLGGPASVEPSPDATGSPGVTAQPRDSGAQAVGAPSRPVTLVPLEPPDLTLPARLVGDVVDAEFLLTLPTDTRPEALLIGYRSSIDVLPEESRISVFANGVALTSFRPDATDAFGMIELPAGTLQPGENVVRIEARHHHRIYCGAAASFGLWTEIDMMRSGALLSGDALQLGGAGLRAALLAQAAEGSPLDVRFGPGIEPAAARSAFRAVAHATRGLFARPRLLSVWAAASSDQVKARITLLRGPADRIDLVRGGDGALVLLIVMASEDASWVAGEVEDLLRPGLSRAVPFVLEPGAGASLAAIGGGSEFALEGRYDTETLRFVIPEGWIAPPSGRATLAQRYAFAAGHAAGSFLTVEINGQPVQSLPLDAETPPAAPLSIRFDPAILRRGVNTLAFSVLSPGDPPDLPCPLGEPHPTTTISGESALVLPRSAPMRLAGVAPAVLGLGGASLETGDGGDDDFARVAAFAALEPVIPAPEARLRVVSITDLTHADTEELGVTTADVAAALARGRRAAREEAPPVDTVAYWADWRRLLWTLRDGLERLDTRPVGNGAPLALWLGEAPALAVLLQPHRARPNDLLMVLEPSADALSVARSLDRARMSGRGPDGRVAVLTHGGDWRSWFAASEPPVLLAPLEPSNATTVLGTYASWVPEAFALGGLGATWVSAAIGVVLIRQRRRRDGE